ALRELNQRILQSDRTLLIAARPRSGPRPAAAASGAPSPDGAARQRPAMLPGAVPGFTGREAQLCALSAAPAGTPASAMVISGTPGVGKTALAVHWAREHADGFPGGQLYVNLRGFGPADPLRPTEALRIFLDALAVPAAEIPATLDGRQSLY